MLAEEHAGPGWDGCPSDPALLGPGLQPLPPPPVCGSRLRWILGCRVTETLTSGTPELHWGSLRGLLQHSM